MNVSSAFPRVRTSGQTGDYKMGRAKLTIFPKDKGNSPGSSASQWNPAPLISSLYNWDSFDWRNVSFKSAYRALSTVNKDHKILNSPLNLFWSLNKVPMGRETEPPRCFPQHSPGWPGLLPQGKPSLPATEALNFYHNYAVKPRQCLFVVFHVGPDTWWTTVLV